MLLHVHLIDIASVVELRRDHLGIFGCATLNARRGLLILVIGRIRLTPRGEQGGCHDVELWHALLKTRDILIVHAPPAALAETLVGF